MKFCIAGNSGFSKYRGVTVADKGHEYFLSSTKSDGWNDSCSNLLWSILYCDGTARQ